MHESTKLKFLEGDAQRVRSVQGRGIPTFQSTFRSDVTTLPAHEYKMTMEFFRYFNEADDEVAVNFFRKEGILGPEEALRDNSLVRKYLRIEKIANIVERGNSEVAQEQFGRSVLPAHTYLEKVMNDQSSARIALRLQHEHYTVSDIENATPRFIRSYDEYRLYNFTHILRVARLGLSLWAEQSDKFFHDVNPQILEEFLLLHDQSKINGSAEFLSRHELEAAESISSKLYQNYSIDFAAIPDAWKKETGDLVNQLNAVDKDVAIAFFRKKGLLGASEDIDSNPLVQKYLNIEKVADLVDRGTSPVTSEEFGRAMLPAHTFFVKVLKDFESAAFAAALDYRYDQITKGDDYMEHIPIVRLALKRHQWDSGKRVFTGHRGECMQYMTEIMLNSTKPSIFLRANLPRQLNGR